MSLSILALASLAAIPSVQAFFKVACSGEPLVQERIDPIINPGVIGSNHIHTIEGANNFAANNTFDTLRASTCSSCQVFPQDKSNYWYPKLYFQDPKTGKFDAVPNGGLLVYYEDRGDDDPVNGGPGLVAFPAGFKMVSGSPVKRSQSAVPNSGTQAELMQRANEWACLRYGSAQGYNNQWDYANGKAHGFPHTNCESGLNMRLHFPACWDGVNLYKNDNSHVAYLDRLDNGKCPDGYPKGLLALFYEVTWNVNSFVENGRWDGVNPTWPFVLATGDPTGFSWHGDFQTGWDVTALQNPINDCMQKGDGAGDTSKCKWLTLQSGDQADACKLAPVVNEAITGNLTKLPGCNPIQSGPQDATLYSTSNCPI